MNAENFSDYIDDPSLLYQMNYQELKQLILAYPFCSNLRYLIAKKTKQEQHLDVTRNLRLASVYSPDRKQLFKYLMSEEIVKAIDLEEETLELKQLNELDLQPIELVLDDQPAAETPEISFNYEEVPEVSDTAVETPLEESTELEQDGAVDSIPAHSEEDNEINVALEGEPELLEELPIIEDTPFVSEPIQELPLVAETSTDLPPANIGYIKKRNRYRQPELSILSSIEPITNTAESSTTETVPKVLPKKIQKSIAVYEQLALLFPEKSDFFAAKIEKLKESIE